MSLAFAPALWQVVRIAADKLMPSRIVLPLWVISSSSFSAARRSSRGCRSVPPSSFCEDDDFQRMLQS